ncbi:MAG: MTAP family purine nucleoside phosphorylase [Patescibacteria group bacterium]
MALNKIAIIGGSGLIDFKMRGVVFMNRHGKAGIPPHKINYKKNILILKKRGVKQIIGVCSVGSLKLSIKPGSIIIPHDYINFNNILTFFNNKVKHIIPGLDQELREKIIKACLDANLKIRQKGVYFQAAGPRFETKAEVNIIKNYADIVGMTMASEATLAKEIGLPYASVCLVDNYAHGIIKKQFTAADWKNNQKKNKSNLLKLLKVVLKNI